MTAFYGLPSWLLLSVAVVLFVAVACAGLLVVRRAFPGVDFRVYNDVGGIALGIAGGLFGVTLAFIIAIVWQEFDGTSQRVAIEAGAATDLWHVASGLPQPLRGEVRRELAAYARLMVEDEWPQMRTGGSSRRAEQLLTRMFESVARFEPANAGATNVHAAALQYLGTLHDARHHRLDDNQSGLSPFEWAVLLLGVIVVVGICYLVGLPSLRIQLLMTGAIAGLIASMFVLVFELDYPFRGDLAVQPTGWYEFLASNRSEL